MVVIFIFQYLEFTLLIFISDFLPTTSCLQRRFSAKISLFSYGPSASLESDFEFGSQAVCGSFTELIELFAPASLLFCPSSSRLLNSKVKVFQGTLTPIFRP